MKAIIFSIFIILCVVSAFAQNTFEYRFPAVDHQSQSDLVEDNNGNLILLNIYRLQGDDFYSRLVKISPNGDSISCTMKIADMNFIGYRLIIDKDNSIFLAGSKWYNDTAGNSGYYYVAKFDEELNLIFQNDFIMPSCYKNADIASFIKWRNYYLIGGTAGGQAGCITRNDVFVVIVDTSGNLINSKFFNESVNHNIMYDIQFDSMSSVFRVVCDGYSLHSSVQYITIDTNMNITRVQDIPILFEQPVNLYIKSKDSIVITNAFRNLSSFFDTKVNIAMLDTNMQVLANMYWDSVESYDPPAWSRNLVVLEDGSYAVGGTIQTVYEDKPSWFILGRATEGMLGMWERYYGGDYFYTMCNIIRTSDGGYAMAGYYSDTLTPGQRGIYLLKVNSDGLLNGMTENEILEHSVIVYCDQARDQLVIRSSYIDDIDIRLFDIQGKLVLHKQGLSGESRIPVSSFQPGSLFYEIRDQHNHRTTGKVIVN